VLEWSLKALDLPPEVTSYLRRFNDTPIQKSGLVPSIMDESDNYLKIELAHVRSQFSEVAKGKLHLDKVTPPDWCLSPTGDYTGYLCLEQRKKVSNSNHDLTSSEDLRRFQFDQLYPDLGPNSVPLMAPESRGPGFWYHEYRDALRAYNMELKEYNHSMNSHRINRGSTGLPQGSCLSPFLSIAELDLFLKNEITPRFPGVSWVFYADDGLFYGDDLAEFTAFKAALPEICKRYNFSIAHHKSQHSKCDGVWLSDSIKFLGIRFTVSDCSIRSETRKGAKLL
jgi:hypothetical protein